MSNQAAGGEVMAVRRERDPSSPTGWRQTLVTQKQARFDFLVSGRVVQEGPITIFHYVWPLPPLTWSPGAPA